MDICGSYSDKNLKCCDESLIQSSHVCFRGFLITIDTFACMHIQKQIIFKSDRFHLGASVNELLPIQTGYEYAGGVFVLNKSPVICWSILLHSFNATWDINRYVYWQDGDTPVIIIYRNADTEEIH